MTLDEAKKILIQEGYTLKNDKEIGEAKRTLAAYGWTYEKETKTTFRHRTGSLGQYSRYDQAPVQAAAQEAVTYRTLGTHSL
jgi:hypothetical protein